MFCFRATSCTSPFFCCYYDFPGPEKFCCRTTFVASCAEIHPLKKIFLEVCGSISERKLSFTPRLVWFLMSVNSPIKNSTFYYHPTLWALYFFCGYAAGFIFASAAIWCQLLVLHEPLQTSGVIVSPGIVL